MFALLAVYLAPDRFSTVEGIHELALGPLNRVCGDLREPRSRELSFTYTKRVLTKVHV